MNYVETLFNISITFWVSSLSAKQSRKSLKVFQIFTDTYWLKGELHYIKHLKKDFILKPIRLILSIIEDTFQNGCCVSDWFGNRIKDP